MNIITENGQLETGLPPSRTISEEILGSGEGGAVGRPSPLAFTRADLNEKDQFEVFETVEVARTL